MRVLCICYVPDEYQAMGVVKNCTGKQNMNDLKDNWKDKFKSKVKATSIHLLLSLLVFAVISYFIVFEWYPGVLFSAEGGLTGVKLMAAIQLVLGPGLTFIVFNHNKAKKEIVFDLSIIVMLQISALIWGGLQVYSQRPVALVIWEGVFYTVTEDYYKKQDIVLKDITSYSNEKPLIIYAETDHSVEQLKEIQRLNGQKIPPYAQVHLYKPVKDSIKTMLSHQLSNIYLMGLGNEYIAESNQHVFTGKAKHGKLLIYLDSKANLIAIKSIQ